MSIDNTARAELRSFIERIERLEEEKAAIAGDIKDVKGEAKGRGYDVTAINTILKLRKKDANERMEEEAILDTYMIALGMMPEPTLSNEDHDRQTGEVHDINPRLAKKIVDGMQTETGRAALVAAVDIMIERAEAEDNTPSDAAPRLDTAVIAPSDDSKEETDTRRLLTNSPETANEMDRATDGSLETGSEAAENARKAIPAQGPTSLEDGNVSHAGAGETPATSCEYCDGTGDVHRIDGEWLGFCHCEYGKRLQGVAEYEIDPTEDRPQVKSLGGNVDANAGGSHVTAQASIATEAGDFVNHAPAHKPLRPLCKRPGAENCGGHGSTHCHECLVEAGLR